MNILYITRKYPPSIGGMQKQSYEFNEALKKKVNLVTIAWTRSQIWLPFIFVSFLIRGSFSLLRYKIDIIQLGDLVLSPLGVLLRRLFKRSVLAMAHGRDTGCDNYIYRKFIIPAIKNLDGVICVSSNLKERLIAKGIDGNKLFVIPNGIEADSFKVIDKEAAYNQLKRIYGLELDNKKIIFLAARFVKKKGIDYFLQNILPQVFLSCNNAICIFAGDGPERKRIKETVKKLGYLDKVKLVGLVRSKSSLQYFYSAADVFIMPNRRVPSDAEGFGVVALEAGLCGIPVVAFGVDGITQAVLDHKTGFLVEENRPNLFAEKIISIINSPAETYESKFVRRNEVIENFGWDKLIGRFLACYNALLKYEE